MEFLHTMLRVSSVEDSLRFFCEGLGLREVRRVDNEKGRFTLVFLAAPDDIARAENSARDMSQIMSGGLPTIELTYNWPAEDGSAEDYTGGRSFGHLAYRTADIYALCAHLSKMGVTINRPPRDGHMAFVRSPDGISVELLQKGERLPPRAPWKDMDNTGSW